jgi:hypothetical protein
MSQASDIERFVKAPSLLVELCREVIDRLDVGSPDLEIREKEAQLRAISKAIEQLEKTGIPVPNTLRGEKTRLAADLGTKSKLVQVLNHLADQFDKILRDLKVRIGRGASTSAAQRTSKPRSRSPKSEMNIFKEQIVLALRNLSGRAKATEVIEEVGKQLEGKLLPGDMEWNESKKMYAWQHKAQWARFQMTQDGTLRSDSPRGIWELGEDNR